MKKTISVICYLLSVICLLAACDWRLLDTEGWASSPTPNPSMSAAPTDTPWQTVPKKRYNELFGLAWDNAHISHPLAAANRYNDCVYTLVYDSLFTLDERFEPVPNLCASITTTDNLSFTLTLVDAVFHDGSPLVAADVVYSLKAVGFNAYEVGEGVAVALAVPNPRLAAELVTPIVKAGSMAYGFPWAGTGPYAFVWGEDDDGNGSMHLESNAAWWRRGALPLARIELCDASRPYELPYKMGVSDISLIVEDAGDSFGVSYRGDFERWGYPTTILQYMAVNPATLSPDAAQAISAIIDRSAIAASIYGGAADPTGSAIHPASPLYPATATSLQTADPQAFETLCEVLDWQDLNEDGLLDQPVGRTRQNLSLTILVSEEDNILLRAASGLRDQLIGAGIDCRVDARPLHKREGGLSDALTLGEYDLYLTGEDIGAGFNSHLDVIPLLFRRQTLLTQRGMITDADPLYKQPFHGISKWTVKK
ncbi:hypothetical protein FACS1894217_03260 [Clostridia bacterium]|nr:hypothetical protein FACS1894217_03260 [Clostridia bacterium]